MRVPAKVSLTRRVSFSSGHRYWFEALNLAQNQELFGEWASPYSHGHNYQLDVTTRGVVDPGTGMVVNIKTIDDYLDEKIVAEFEGRSMNDEIDFFKSHAPCIENILGYIWDRLNALPPEAELIKLRLQETPTLWGELSMPKNREIEGREKNMTLTRSYEFAASHRLFSPDLTDRENEELFGKCSNPAGHGHNYILDVTVSGDPDARTGMMVDLARLDQEVNALVVDRYDHKNLNCDLPEFEGKTTTSEVVAQQIWSALNGKLPAKLERVRLQETARSFFEVSSE